MSPAESNVEMSRLDDREEGSDGLRHRGSRPVSAPSMNRGGISSAQHEQDPKDM